VLVLAAPDTTHVSRYPCLDGIRGIAILFVLASHISNRRDLVLAGAGQFGVWLFFVLSAFLLSLYFFEEPERLADPLEWANYALRRFLRIYPAYTISLLIGAAVGDWSLSSVFDQLTLKTSSYWAIYVEFRFYLLLPIAAAAFYGLGRVHKSLPPLATVGAIAGHFMIFPDGSTVPGYDPQGPYPLLLWEYLIVFLLGVFAAWAYVSLRDGAVPKRVARSVDLVLLAIAVAPWLVSIWINMIGLAPG
jgi:peptidoglycan/LPS O-acetylase OafA/YrhL